ncbi:damage-control phosphatase ARMT1 family protein [Sporobolomyces salmoneus]|uniref:damage-control phosphatase ARMT1 family protein n=1 Tax=Sporobolomyces salmoneus TaxID=183962 RepID=UPI00317ADFA5
MPHWIPPVPVSSASQPYSFACESTKTRWPKILTGIVDELSKLNHQLSSSDKEEDKDKVKEGKELIEKMSGLIYEIKTDKPLKPLEDTGYPHDHAVYNEELARQEGKTWFTASWLFAECYLYRLLRSFFSLSTHFTSFDPFSSQKLSTWRSSSTSVVQLSSTLNELVEKGRVEDKGELRRDWRIMMETMLWGNATDLSLLTSLTHEQIQELQSVERGREYTLRDDLEKAWEHVKDSKDERFDIVLDNSGFELFTDLVLADFLITLTPFARKVVIHPKLIPWFVSDVLPHDFEILFSTLSDPLFFPSLSSSDQQELETLVTRWKGYVESGQFELSVPRSLQMGEGSGNKSVELAEFWTSPYPFSDLPLVAPELLEEFKKSKLVIFKGDLNYRKLVSDAWWEPSGSFEDALGPLGGKINLLSLRTLKADTVVGLSPGKAEELDEKEGKGTWRVNGKYAVVSFAGRENE